MTESLTDQEILNIEECAKGCAAGRLSDWPEILSGLKKLGIDTGNPKNVGSQEKQNYCILAVEIIRLRSGGFTAEEIHNICHSLKATVPIEEFCNGCAKEQRKLYGKSPDADDAARWRFVNKWLRRAGDFVWVIEVPAIYGEALYMSIDNAVAAMIKQTQH